MALSDSLPPIRVFLLSVWQEMDSIQGKLRFRLEDPHTGESHNFSDLEQLGAYLQTRISGQ